RNNALKLVHRIHKEDDFVPDIIYSLLRGGAYLANVFSEYYKLVRKSGRPVFYAAVVARSYTDIREQTNVMIDGWTYSPEHLRTGDKILIVDDIFDTGKTINKLCEVIMEKGIPREDLKVAVHDYKIPIYKGEHLPIQPDYYCRQHIIKSPETDTWIHYMSHEFVGLTMNEIYENYNDPESIEILNELKNNS
ncbi:MAG: phosphoribosyltransferase, partial [Candidatus Brocadiales bacterium]|nr:phosphoribosyltransferase [Candidatus Brocadiales bacterium]